MAAPTSPPPTAPSATTPPTSSPRSPLSDRRTNQQADRRIQDFAGALRAGRACKRSDRDDEFRRLLGLAAQDLQVQPVDYGHRRRHLNADWDIPEDDWQRLRDAMLAARVARKDTPWERRRIDLRIWLWSHITGGDPVLAPMVQATTAARRCTNQAIDSYTTLRRRAVPAMEEIVLGYAGHLTERIDRSAAFQPSTSAHAA